MKKNENAFTGLEAAIVLIAFVVVAAVFSYVMLGAGFFTAQEAQSVVHTGMGQAASSIEVLGDVYGFNNTDSSGIDNITFTIALTSGNTPMDIARMRVTLATPTARNILELAGTTGKVSNVPRGNWSVTNIYDEVNTGDLVLDPNEKFQITVRPPLSNVIPADTRFTITMQPEVGAMTTVVRTTPADMKAVNILR
ncbi:archaellin/type IV pilin N-terminal domain-containing protein [Methanocalculus sp.]|uniref:archaellin/type IV pilin N-terminal domain-containing protein n=1 Tax=Methanocalculus sp. TaxID=2004547 RepID=UPI00262C0C4A|nr:archaellin/type IV pilin N-terminal domain-containing protein [Methanocalculus sp.]MDG6249520.1 flagellin [Methanocalculus sp.]